ncbi:lipase 1-like [Nylanderia fulva]|uniref:lipase 1-like n=1 Tax=Nylanderia fulva TaxID=613905 RepID=UPI0010FB4B84|nr:lipase 1-like [Nylanderia fulva]
MRLLGITLIVSFCGRLAAALTDTIPNRNVLEEATWATWKQRNNIKINPDVFLSTPEMIRRTGYPAEAHVITTEDGYLLTLHRIPGGKNSLPVLLQHGLASSSADWIVLGKGKALADQGYDVWLGNFRGNVYSRAHISLSPSNSTFWDFSYHEMGIYDLPAMITFITNMRSQSLHAYIGHSMGSTSFYVMASRRPEIAQMVQKMIGLGPAVFIDHIKGLLRYLAPFARKIQTFMEVLFHGEFLQRDLTKLFAKLCNQNLSTQEFCLNVIFMINGFDYEQFNYNLLPLIMNHIPAGSSAKSWIHYTQGIPLGTFREYDYGREKNLLMYNSVEPPDYDLTKITVPIALFYGNNDYLVNPVVSNKKIGI